MFLEFGIGWAGRSAEDGAQLVFQGLQDALTHLVLVSPLVLNTPLLLSQLVGSLALLGLLFMMVSPSGTSCSQPS